MTISFGLAQGTLETEARVLHVHLEDDPSEFLSAISVDTGQWYAAQVLVLVSLVMALPALLGIRHIVEVRRPALASLASIAFVPEMIALAALVGLELVAWQMAQPGFDRARMITLWANVSKNAGIVPMIFVAVLFSIAWLLAGIGLYLAQFCPRWAAGARWTDAARRLRERAHRRPQMARCWSPNRVRDRPDTNCASVFFGSRAHRGRCGPSSSSQLPSADAASAQLGASSTNNPD